MSNREAIADGSSVDVVVVGGGIIGAGIARDAARRGLRVALLEQADFGGGTTSASTRLIHGGLRYLASGDFRLVRLDLRERETLLRIAPHLVKPLPFLLPFRRDRPVERLKLRAGMFLYDALSFDKSLPRHRLLDASEMKAFEPALEARNFSGAALYYDAQVHSPERLTLENVLDAAAHGALVMNYAEVTAPLHTDGRLAGVAVTDRLTGEQAVVRARVVINASGPWLDRAAARLGVERKPLLRTTKGVHVACEPFTTHAVAISSAIDGRMVFAIPWAGSTWVGTTDSDFRGDPAFVSATAEDVEYLVGSLAPYLPHVRRVRHYWTCAGVRALVGAGGSASEVTRMHRIVSDVPGLISVVGGKITGYRAIAEQVTDRICRELRLQRTSSTTEPLPGAGAKCSATGQLEDLYGCRADQVRALVDADPSPGGPARGGGRAELAAQVAFSIRHEWCVHLEDFMLRRSYLGFASDRGLGAADTVSRVMQRELKWSEERRRDELTRYESRVREDLLTAPRHRQSAMTSRSAIRPRPVPSARGAEYDGTGAE